MLFKNLRLYRLTAPFDLSPEQLHQHLLDRAFRACTSLEHFSYGWAPPLGRRGVQLVHAAGGYLLVCARREEKILPAAVIRDAVEEKAAAIEEQQGRPVRRRERSDLRDEMVQSLLPRALSRSTLTYAYIDPKGGWLVIDSANPRKADELVQLLRESLGTLALQPPQVQSAPAAVMTRWLQGQGLPADFSVGDECELRDTAEDGGVIRCRKQDLGADDVQALLESGRQAVKLAVNWDARLSCVLADDLTVRRLRFEDVVQEEFGAAPTEDEVERFDAEFVMMTLELARFISRLIEVFGGESEETYARSA
ncbi:MAG: recombination-associated protein RdgC [Gammaproteobacteria bacterium]